MFGEREHVASARESSENVLLERAIKEAQASPKVTDAIARYGKTDVAEVIREIVRLTEEGLSRGSQPDAERQFLRTSLWDCGVDWHTAALYTQAFFRGREPEKGLLWQLGDVFRNTGG